MTIPSHETLKQMEEPAYYNRLYDDYGSIGELLGKRAMIESKVSFER
jgi:hypothetical protein